MKRLLFATALLTALYASSEEVQAENTGNTGNTGNTYLNLPSSNQGTFGAGLHTGIIIASELSKSICIPIGATGNQVAAIITKYLNDHPEHRHESITNISAIALMKVYPCK